MTAIYVDADACPVRDEIFRVATRLGLPVHVVSNGSRPIRAPGLPNVQMALVPPIPDAADDWIAERIGPADLCATADIPLAARCLAKGARALAWNGREWTGDNIGAALAGRELGQHLRELGLPTGGPAPLSKQDRAAFLVALDRLLHRKPSPQNPMTLTRRTALAAPFIAPFGLAASRARAAARPIKVAYIPILAMAQLFVIADEGWAAEAGLDLQLTRFSSGPAMVQALASGGYDVAYVGIGPAMVARAAGLDLRVVAANGVGQGSLIAVGDFAAAYPSAPDPKAAFAAFRAKSGRPVRIATLPKGSVPDTVLRYWLDEIAHVDPADVQVQGVGEDRVQQALLAGSADAASALEPILTIVQERVPSARILVPGGAMFPDQPGSTLAMRETFIQADRKAAETLVALHVRATKLILDDPARAAAATLKIIGAGLVSPETLTRAFRSPASHPIADPHAIVAATDRLAAFQVRIGALARAVPAAELFDTSLYDALPPAQR